MDAIVTVASASSFPACVSRASDSKISAKPMFLPLPLTAVFCKVVYTCSRPCCETLSSLTRITQDDIKSGSNYLRGTILEGLADESTGALAERCV